MNTTQVLSPPRVKAKQPPKSESGKLEDNDQVNGLLFLKTVNILMSLNSILEVTLFYGLEGRRRLPLIFRVGSEVNVNIGKLIMLFSNHVLPHLGKVFTQQVRFEGIQFKNKECTKPYDSGVIPLCGSYGQLVDDPQDAPFCIMARFSPSGKVQRFSVWNVGKIMDQWDLPTADGKKALQAYLQFSKPFLEELPFDPEQKDLKLTCVGLRSHKNQRTDTLCSLQPLGFNFKERKPRSEKKRLAKKESKDIEQS